LLVHALGAVRDAMRLAASSEAAAVDDDNADTAAEAVEEVDAVEEDAAVEEADDELGGVSPADLEAAVEKAVSTDAVAMSSYGASLKVADERAASIALSLDWAALVDRLPTHRPDDRAARGTMFDVCGQGEAVSLAQVLDGLLAELRPRSGLVQQLCAGAITRAFAAVAQLPNTRVSSDISTGINRSPDDPAIEDVNDPLIGRWGFSLVLLYLRRYIELLVILDHIDPSCERYMQQDEFIAVLPKVQQVCGVVVESPAAEFEQLNDGSGEISFDTFSHWVLNQNLEQFAADDEAAAEEAAVQRVVGIPMGQVARLTTVPETTERSVFSDAVVTSDLSHVQHGFFDASRLVDVAEGDSDGEYQQPETYEQALDEIAQLRFQLKTSRTQQAKVDVVMKTNEVLQQQLKELHGIVEGVVQREMHRHRQGQGASRAKRAPTGPKVLSQGPGGLFATST